jgi:putative Mg2+ transporter-C (MgtC) family protein
MEPLRQMLEHYGKEMPTVLASTVARLLFAAALGGLIGLERELRHKPAGLRTNMFICFGAAMFTVLSDQLASLHSGDHTRIAAQIIPGIGFIGAGSILHSRGSVVGLTTAATLFTVASIGMAAGGGLYITAIFATGLILIALGLLGRVESRFSLKSQLVTYEVSGKDPDTIVAELNRVLDVARCQMQSLHLARTDAHTRAVFDVVSSAPDQEELKVLLHQSSIFGHVTTLATQQHE